MPAKGIALHIGLNAVNPKHYDDWDGELHAAENDARVYQAISKKAGFKDSLLLTRKATSTAVIRFLEDASKKLTTGDTLFLTYSGHGGSVVDLNKDEGTERGEEDGFDETWCLYDRQLLDDELYSCFSTFKKGVRILIFSDSCHSGSIAKMVRRDKAKEDLNPDTYRKSRLAPLGVLVNTFDANEEVYARAQSGKRVNRNTIPAYVLQFGACQDHEEAFEGWGNGLFTAKLKKVLEGLVKNYRELYEKIKTGFTRDQNPNLFQYGNKTYDFTNLPPFQIAESSTKKNGFFTPEKPGSSKSTKAELIVELYEGAAKSRGQRVARMMDKKLPKNGVQPGPQTEKFVVQPATDGNETEWDQAYALVLKNSAARFAEPNVESVYLKREDARSAEKNEYLKNWPRPASNATEFIWHLDDEHSQLRKAYLEVIKRNASATVRIGHLDTGYLPNHPSTPKHLRKEWAVSFVKNEFGNNPGIDKADTGSIAEQDGHGCATMAILAGKEVAAVGGYPVRAVEIGAIPFAEVVPIRICETVFNSFNANDVAEGIDHAVNYGCEVITMSMAGYPTRRVAEAVNRAYENGVIIVTAAGNSFTSGIGKLSPRAILYPARFSRVIAATGACYNGEPYDLDANSWYRSRMAGGETMQGNWGPESAMKTALAGYTPNVAWASTVKGQPFSRSGGGTSSATPQVAAAAALWIAYNRQKIEAAGIQKSWRKVEAARKALFNSANKSYPAYRKYYGNGVVRAFDALNAFDFSTVHKLQPSEKASVRLTGLGEFFTGWFRSRAASKTLAPDASGFEGVREMISLELLQLIHRDPALMQYAEELDLERDETSEFFSDPTARRSFAQKVLNSPYASAFLKQCMNDALE